MAFAKDYTEEITMGYYCFNLAFAMAFFIFGTIYLRHRDKRDQQRREWRQFAERIYGEYSKLKDKDIPRRISKVKDTFDKIQMNSATTGLDVLRYMLAEGNYERSKTTQLECLREDLQSIFPLFNVCSSLLLLGKVPKNIKEELTDVISDLGKMAVHFFKGKQRKIILKCLEHFSNDRPQHETERRIRELDDNLEATVPYAKSCLIFGTSEGSLPGQLYVLPGSFGLAGFHHSGRTTMELENRRDYSKCSNFSLYIKENNPQRSGLISLRGLHKDLEDPRYLADFARELRKKQPVPRLNLIEEITHLDTDKRVVEKVLHEVRVYIHLLLNGSQQQEQIRVNVTRLCEVKEEITKVRPTEAVVKGICERFIEDLARIQTSQYHCNSEEFCGKLNQLWCKMQEIQIIPWTQSRDHLSCPQLNLISIPLGVHPNLYINKQGSTRTS
ncbi:uncharacterized protein LOC110068733 [Orbicella faveolata]|uniref:uncharacterized protein LOC110068733 n=1 Tax=Orbicella faveolata TaxID=48498 RepID=UPI0009E1A9B2|nr:uncharacterized protein LOC110068733 [Orbicella faveolata]